MTVLAAFVLENCPLLLSDMLISNSENMDREYKFPMVRDFREVYPEKSGWIPETLSQKIVIISDSLVIGWAGSKLGALMAIKQLREICSDGVYSVERIKYFLDNMNVDTRNLGATIVGFLHDGENICAFDYEAKHLELGKEIDVLIAGSGADLIEKTSRANINKFLNPHMQWTTSRAYEFGISLAGTYLWLEGGLRSPVTFENYFGGFFEVAFFDGEKFTKGDGITYVMWEGKEPDGNGWLRPVMTIRSYYHSSGELLLFCQRFKAVGDGFEFDTSEFYSIAPFEGRPNRSSKFTPNDIPEKLGYVCNCTGFRLRSGGIRQQMYVKPMSNDGSDWVDFVVTNGFITEFKWKKAFWDWIRKFAIDDTEEPTSG